MAGVVGNGVNRALSYDRQAVVHYARRWWSRFNPAFPAFADDCTNFVSQALQSGGWPQVPGKRREEGWWIEPHPSRRAGAEPWSFSWAVSHALRTFWLSTGRGRDVPDANLLTVGDLIFYDWDGDGRYTHSALVVGSNSDGLLTAAHSYPAYGVPWAYRHSKAWTDRTRYSLVQVGGGR